ncbi:hypothetical protein GGF46_002131 [Coemansia sp. RSA 552]|nr:hypothetical protein GGF46_002131 [Coemansia sp. RSA 552]
MLRVLQSFSRLAIRSQPKIQVRAVSVSAARLFPGTGPSRAGRKPVAKKPAKKLAKKPKAAAKKKAKKLVPKGRPKKKKPTQKELVDAKLNSKRALIKAPTARAPGPFALFMKDVVLELPKDMPFVERTREVASRWSGLGAAEKQAYSDQSARMKTKLTEEARQWWNNVDRDLVMLENSRRRRQGVAKSKGLLKDPFAPRRPLTSYALFLTDYVKDNMDSAGGAGLEKYNGLMADGAKKWRGLSESSKAPYVKAAQVEKDRYEQDMGKYKKSHTPVHA